MVRGMRLYPGACVYQEIQHVSNYGISLQVTAKMVVMVELVSMDVQVHQVGEERLERKVNVAFQENLVNKEKMVYLE